MTKKRIINPGLNHVKGIGNEARCDFMAEARGIRVIIPKDNKCGYDRIWKYKDKIGRTRTQYVEYKFNTSKLSLLQKATKEKKGGHYTVIRHKYLEI